MSRSINISTLVAVAVAAAALAAPAALADPLPIRLAEETSGQGPVRADVDGSQPQFHGVAEPRGVVGPSVGYEVPAGLEPTVRSAATAAASSDGIAWLDATIGGAIGFALALVLLVSAQTGRARMRTAHS